MRIALLADVHGNLVALERLAALPDAVCVRGNTDRYLCTGDRPPPTRRGCRCWSR